MEIKNPGTISFSDEELQVLVAAIYAAQDLYEDALINMGQVLNAVTFHGGVLDDVDAAAMKGLELQQACLDVVRKKLGDQWEPADDLKAPNDLSAL